MATGKDIAVEANKSVFNDADLSSIKSMDDALKALGSVTEIEDYNDYGSGFDVIEDKDLLKGVPFVIIEWRFSHSKQFDQEFVSALVMDENDRKSVVNDGSTGIYAQLRAVTDKRIKDNRPYPQAGLICRSGLRRSDYEVEDDKGKTIAATTYYIA